MGETKQTAEIANRVADSIFCQFGWKRAGTTDHNFKGLAVIDPPDEEEDSAAQPDPGKAVDENTPADAKSSKKQPKPSPELKDYPADVVFYYDDPYFHLRNYIHFDLKSYGAGSIKANTIVKALRSLSRVIGIADSSEDWARKFAPQQSNYRIHGGLFVYNHDNQEAGRFAEFYSKLTPRSARVPEKKNLYVFGPERISYLLSVVNDLKNLRGDEKEPIPNSQNGEISFFYPYGAKIKPQNNLLGYATAEMLLGPILIVRYRFKDNHASGYIIYYDGPGSEVEEFLYIFELLLKRHLITDTDKVRLRLMHPADNAFVVFKEAKEEFVKAYHDLPAFRAQVDRIDYHSGFRVTLHFSTIELGME